MTDVICMPLCLKHDAPRPCPICDKKEGYDTGYWNSVYYLADLIAIGENTTSEVIADIKDSVIEKLRKQQKQ